MKETRGMNCKCNKNKIVIAYVVADLKRVGPSKQTLNIIENCEFKDDCFVVTLFNEPEDSMINDYKKNGIDIICLNLNRIFFMLNGTNKLRAILERKRVNIVHSYGVKPDCICQKVCKKSGMKHIITLRNYPKEDIISRMGVLRGHIALRAHLKVLKKALHVVACSKTIERKMNRDYPNMNITTIQNGVDLEKYERCKQDKRQIRKEVGFPLDKQIFISTSSFIKRKRIEESIKGFLKMKDNGKSMFVLLGEGEYFELISNRYSHNENLIFLGKKSNVKDYLFASDVFVSSSESEGLPNGVIEAIAAGLPVLLSDIPQHIEILDEVPHSGKTYRLGDIDDLAENMSAMATFDNSECSIGNSQLTMKKMGMSYSDYYKELF